MVVINSTKVLWLHGHLGREVTRTWEAMQIFQKFSPIKQVRRGEQTFGRKKEATDGNPFTFRKKHLALREQPVRHWGRWRSSNRKGRR